MASLKSIRCKYCSAPMHFYHESRQIETITCEYCNQTHSVKENFKTLYRYQKSMNGVRRILLGTVGKIKNIEFTIIGYVIYTNGKAESLNGLNSSEWWIEYQLYSKTHGYAYLTYEDGSYYFYHRVYDLPKPLMNHAKELDTIYFRDNSFTVEESYNAYAYFVAGTLTWKAKVADSSYCVDAKSSSGWFSRTNNILSYERSKTEEEYFLGEPIESLDESFLNGITTLKQQKKSTKGTNRVKKESMSRDSKRQYLLSLISLIAFLVSFVALILLFQTEEYKIFQQDFKTTKKESNATFELNNLNVKHTIQLKANILLGEKVHKELTIREANSSYNTLEKDIDMSSKNPTKTISFEPSIWGKKYLLTLKDKNSTANTTLKLTMTQPLLKRYFVVLLIVSIIGIFLGYLLKDGKEAWITLLIATILVYIVAMYPSSFLFLGLVMIGYFASKLGENGLVGAFFFYVLIINILL